MYFRGVFLFVKKYFLEILAWGCLNVKKNKNWGCRDFTNSLKNPTKTTKTAKTDPTASQETAKRKNKKNNWKMIEK